MPLGIGAAATNASASASAHAHANSSSYQYASREDLQHRSHGLPSSSKSTEPVAMVSINHLAPIVRQQLTRRAFQDELEKRTQTVIVTRGMHVTDGSTQNQRQSKETAKQRPMHLYITAAPAVPWADKQAAVDAAVSAVSELMGPNDLNAGGASDARAPRSHPHEPPSVRVVRGTDCALAYTTQGGGVEAADRIRGPGGANLDYFAAACPGVTASVRGRGTGVAEDEPLHIRVDWIGNGSDEDATREETLQRAAYLASELVICVM